MSAHLVFFRRTQKEIELFGGEIFFDIDGRNIGKLGTTDYLYEVEQGEHKIKMYKSHSYGSFIGFAETELKIRDDENLLVKYSAPMLVNQPGNIIISDYATSEQTDRMAQYQEAIITRDDNETKQKINEQEERSRNSMIIFAILLIICAIVGVIYYTQMMSYIDSSIP